MMCGVWGGGGCMYLCVRACEREGNKWVRAPSAHADLAWLAGGGGVRAPSCSARGTTAHFPLRIGSQPTKLHQSCFAEIFLTRDMGDGGRGRCGGGNFYGTQFRMTEAMEKSLLVHSECRSPT
jgi:hypothetical protein